MQLTQNIQLGISEFTVKRGDTNIPIASVGKGGFDVYLPKSMKDQNYDATNYMWKDKRMKRKFKKLIHQFINKLK